MKQLKSTASIEDKILAIEAFADSQNAKIKKGNRSYFPFFSGFEKCLMTILSLNHVVVVIVVIVPQPRVIFENMSS